jgi:hypothetical protein
MDEHAEKPTSPNSRERPYYARNVEFHHLASRDADFRIALKAASKDGFIDFQDEGFVL